MSCRELLALLRTGMCAQSILSLLWQVEFAAQDEVGRTTLASIAQANRNSILLTRMVVATGRCAYKIPLWVRLMVALAAVLPSVPGYQGLRPLFEQTADLGARDSPDSPLSRLRMLTRVRHLTAAREDLIDTLRSPGPAVDSFRGWSLSAATAAAQAVATYPTLYRTTVLAPTPMSW
ncbi:hypothetical protein [Nocardia alni]|uniref:hypothetical protein n=1 Tax=Nocardia alni TaxID=2815723 RepID=UPI001C2271E1|nr:hypothetical protein [Nocardia alni]